MAVVSWILAKFGFPQAVGVYADSQSVYVSRVTAAPLGNGAQEHFVVALRADEPQSEGVERALERLAGRPAGLPVAAGVPTDKSYFATRPVSRASVAASPQVLLRESLRSASISVDNLSVDVAKFRPDRRNVVSIAACPQEFTATLAEAFRHQQMRLLRAEPAPCALLRLATRQKRVLRKSPLVVVHLFLNDSHALAVLAVGDRPIAWRTSPLVQGDEAAAILTLVRALATVARPCGIDRPLDAVMVHGRRDLVRLVDADWIGQQLAVSFQWDDGPEFRGEQIARGLALGGLDENTVAFDLVGEVRRAPRLHEIFPWRETVLYAVVLLLLASILLHRKFKLDEACAAALLANGGSVSASLSQGELEQEQRLLENRVEAVQRFVGSRVIWTNTIRQLADNLPPNVYLTSFSGDAAWDTGGKSKGRAKRSLVIQAAVPVTSGGLIPDEVGQLVDSIRHHPQIKKDFPVVELADLKQTRAVDDDRALAVFTVMCLPKKGTN